VTRAEHASEAERLLRIYDEESNLTPYNGRPSNVWLEMLLRRAQVHATLATVAFERDGVYGPDAGIEFPDDQ
jgi:hypothetical protein